MLPGIREKIINLAGQTPPPPRLARFARPPLAHLCAGQRGPGARRLKIFHVYTERHMSQRPFDQ
ncbi:MAG TPA: hypothetical protein VGO91_02330 [Pyrinomonadaceae bacterium]|jgi:hypothetical protein|nr:hypothetical protein [Pyrinomonadaceae bacterium]